MEIRLEIEIAADAAVAWRALGEEFGRIGEWAAAVNRSWLDAEAPACGVTRTCVSPAFRPFPAGTVTERLSEFDPGRMRLAYAATSGFPRFVRSALNRWSIEPLGPDACRVRSAATLRLAWWARPLGPVIRWALRGGMRRFAEDLRHRVERARVEPAGSQSPSDGVYV
jgi:hypothetical protein